MNKPSKLQDFRIALILTPSGIDAITILNNDPTLRSESFHICSLLNDCFLEFEENFKDKYKTLISGEIADG